MATNGQLLRSECCTLLVLFCRNSYHDDMDLQSELSKIIEGDVDTSDETRAFYSHDASLFELVPQAVVFPRSAEDIKALVSFVATHKKDLPNLSLTARSRGTDMSGAAINDSIIVDTSKYMTAIREVSAKSATAEPGLMYRDFEAKTLKFGSILPSYPASRELAGIGGIVNNNSGGEKSLQYGKTDRYTKQMKMVLADGKEYVVGPLTRAALNKKMNQDGFEGQLYRQTFELLDMNYDEIKQAAPKVSKDSTGYHLWNVWDREKGIFDLTQLFVGAQGTLGIMTEATLGLVPKAKYSGTLVCYMPKIDNLGEVIPAVLREHPATFECFDDNTLWLSFKFIFSFIKRLGFMTWFIMCMQLIPDGLALLRGIPKLILLIEFTGDSEEEVRTKVRTARNNLRGFGFSYIEEDSTEAEARKFWLMRRESFNLLRSKVKDKHTAPFIDDLIVPPARLAEFLPKLRKIIKKYKLLATIAGHLGDGNFHVIPLMNIEDPKERAKFAPAMKEVNSLVIRYGGSVSGEHNDGMIRGPWLKEMYSPNVLGYMKEIKALYDPMNIFNPHKKTDATWEYSFKHIRKNF
ncbi:FAD-binding oxidoreductase [Candidatus Saccharibacteria bacterium]|nr:FAD-binding oxidoreductase [Candidatus Saccharibacteria bacterium]